MKINYQKKLDEIIKGIISTNKTPSLLLHSCCAPCSSYVLEYLSEIFKITILYYNPNIYPKIEYQRRLAEQKNFINIFPVKNEVNLIEDEYNESEFLEAIKGKKQDKEGGIRCFACYKLRLIRSAQFAKDNNFEYFTTTLSISPHKNSQKLNEIGKELSEKFEVKYLYSDFKKKDGFKRSLVLSNKYNLYRQDYCGCRFSKNNTK